MTTANQPIALDPITKTTVKYCYNYENDETTDFLKINTVQDLPIKTLFCNINKDTKLNDIATPIYAYLLLQLKLANQYQSYFPSFGISRFLDVYDKNKVYGYIINILPLPYQSDDYVFKLKDIPNLKQIISAIRDANKEGDVPIFIYFSKDSENPDPGKSKDKKFLANKNAYLTKKPEDERFDFVSWMILRMFNEELEKKKYSINKIIIN